MSLFVLEEMTGLRATGETFPDLLIYTFLGEFICFPNNEFHWETNEKQCEGTD